MNPLLPIAEKVAKIDNTFIVNAQYKMTAKEQKVLYFLISHLDPKNEQDFNVITVPLRQLEENLKESSKRSGSLYEEIDRLCANMIAKNVAFPTNILIEGKPLKGRINFFSSIRPIIDDDEQTAIRFSFSPDMKPFLLQLHHYVNIGVLEVVPMTNAHAIRMYSIFKSERNRTRPMMQNVLQIHYTLDELKAVLGITAKYKSDNFKDFRIYVLDKVREEINEHCPTMFVSYDYIKIRRKITGVTFNIYERKPTTALLNSPSPTYTPTPTPTPTPVSVPLNVPVQASSRTPNAAKSKSDIKKYTPSEKELDTLTRAKIQAYKLLIGFGVFEGIAYKQILPKIKGSEFEGFEDFFIEKALLHFEKNAIQNTTKALKASTFVTWWTKNKVFESGDVWSDISEKLAKHKKQLQAKNPEILENRLLAKNMTYAEFEAHFKAKK